MMTELPYAQGQAKALFPFWNDAITMFIIGGVADADEAQTVIERYPGVACLGFEPNAELYNKAKETFPGVLCPVALWNETASAPLYTSEERHRSSRLMGPMPDGPLHEQLVECRRLDSYSSLIGEHRICLWLDIEFSEMKALEGAGELLHQVDLLNIEVVNKEDRQVFGDFLRPFGLRQRKLWNRQRERADIIYIRR